MKKVLPFQEWMALHGPKAGDVDYGTGGRLEGKAWAHAVFGRAPKLRLVAIETQIVDTPLIRTTYSFRNVEFCDELSTDH